MGRLNGHQEIGGNKKNMPFLTPGWETEQADREIRNQVSGIAIPFYKRDYLFVN